MLRGVGEGAEDWLTGWRASGLGWLGSGWRAQRGVDTGAGAAMIRGIIFYCP